METQIIDGKKISDNLSLSVKKEIIKLKDMGIVPCLSIIQIGDVSASSVYVRNKLRKANDLGIETNFYHLGSNVEEDELLALISKLNDDDFTNGILVQLPLPEHIDEQKVLLCIDPRKDVDGFNVSNVGKLCVGDFSGLVSCTPQGCLQLVESVFGIEGLSGKRAVIVGRSNIVGKPMFSLLLSRNCTVTVVHSRTKDIEKICKEADILVVAVGSARLVNSKWIKRGAVVIDVGINYVDTSEGKRKLVGDVDFADVQGIASYITPVPGGVGPMTIANLMLNVIKATRFQNNLKFEELQ